MFNAAIVTDLTVGSCLEGTGWWQHMENTLAMEWQPQSLNVPKKAVQNVSVAADIQNISTVYKRERRPAARDVVSIRCAIFCSA